MNPDRCVILALETSQRGGGVALRNGRGDVHIEMLSNTKRHDDDLLPAIDRLFARLGLKPRDLAGGRGTVAVSIGPGGFTGLRIAISTVKMFAETLGVQVMAVPSACVAGESCASSGPIIVTLACKAESCWCTCLERDKHGHWMIQGEPGLTDALSMPLKGVQTLLGDEHLADSFRTRCTQTGVKIIDPVFDPKACLIVAERMLAAGLTVDPLVLSPLYPRQPEAVTIWEKRTKQD